MLGVDGSTGAGGANVMIRSELRRKFESLRAAAQRVGSPAPTWPLGEERLPSGADLRLAIRRTLRVGERSGTELEDLGVQAAVRHWTTRDDVLAGNIDLLAKAAELLSGMQSYVLRDVSMEGVQHGGEDVIVATVETRGIEWLDVAVDGWARSSQATHDGHNRIVAHRPAGRPAQVLELCGHRLKEGERTLVARRKIILDRTARA